MKFKPGKQDDEAHSRFQTEPRAAHRVNNDAWHHINLNVESPVWRAVSNDIWSMIIEQIRE